MVYETFSSLIKGIEEELETVVNGSVAKRAEDSLARAVQEKVYNRASSGKYRTGALRVSSDTKVQKVNDGLLISVFNNPEKMVGFYDDFGNRAHTSWVDGDEYHDSIVRWTVDGNNSPLYNYKGRNFISYAYDDITNNMVKWLRQSLQARGVKTL